MEGHALTLVLVPSFAIMLLVFAIGDMIIDALSGQEKRDELFVEGPLYRMMMPFFQVIARRTENLRMFDGMRKGLEQRLVMAGKRDAVTPDEIIASGIVMAMIGIVIGVFFDALFYEAPPRPRPGVPPPPPWTPSVFTYMIMAMILGIIPFLGLGSMIKKRHKAIRKVLPYSLDLLTLAVEAGLDFTAALVRISDKLRGNPFQEEVRKLTRDLAMGKTRAEALKDMSERIRMEELQSVVSALVQADELGSALGPTLRIQSSEMRRRRFQAAEKAAMQAPVKMLFPLVVFIFPLVFLVIFGPIVIKFLTGELGAGMF